jgi:hypothetical protein
MQVAYQQQKIKVDSQKIGSKNKDALLFLSHNSIGQMQHYVYYLETILKQSSAYLLQQKCSTVLSYTKKSLHKLQTLYPNVNIEQFKKNNTLVNNKKIKQMLFYENKIIKGLLELYVEEEQKNKTAILEIIKERIKLTSTLIAQV